MAPTLPVREYDRTINSEIERLLYQNHTNIIDAKGLAGDLDNDSFNWQPAPGSWSVGQCFEHLNLIHRKWLPMMEQAATEARRRGLLHAGPYSYGFVSRFFLRLISPPVRMKVSTPAPFRPDPKLDAVQVMEEFESLHHRAEEIIKTANGIDLAKARVASAFSARLRYPLGVGFWILLAHDKRHVLQAREVRNNKGFPPG